MTFDLGRRVSEQYVEYRGYSMAGRTLETTAWQTGDLLFESGDLGRTSVRHAQRSVDRREMSNRFSALPRRTRECVRTKDASSSSKRISSRGVNHSDPLQYQCCSGFYIDIFNSLKDRLKFEFELYQVLDRTWGARNPLTVGTSLSFLLALHRRDLLRINGMD